MQKNLKLLQCDINFSRLNTAKLKSKVNAFVVETRLIITTRSLFDVNENLTKINIVSKTKKKFYQLMFVNASFH